MDVGELQTDRRPHEVLEAPATVPRLTGVPRVAVIDSDTGFVRVLSKRFEALGWEFSVTHVPPELTAMRLSAVVVDLELLGPKRWDWLERVGRDAPELALVVCTRPSPLADRVRGLHLGADDWLSKPCHPEEVVARIDAVLRRTRRASPAVLSESSVAGELEIRSDRYEVFAGGKSLDLTRREFEVLQLLAAVTGKVLRREELYAQVWGYKMARGDRSVDVFVRKLRLKLEGASPGWRYIHTHFGVGYRFEPERVS